MQPKSIFAASQRAAKMVEQDRPVLDFAKTDDGRIRDYLKGLNYSANQADLMLLGYQIIIEIRKKLGIDK